jgi:hypothetical protein
MTYHPDFRLKTSDIDLILYLVFKILPFIAGVICLYYSVRFFKRARQLEDTPLSKLRSAAQGYIELKAKVFPLSDTPNFGILSKKPCVWSRYTIEEFRRYRSGNETITRWDPISMGASSDFFVLNDNTGECVVIPIRGEVITNSRSVWFGNTTTPPPIPEPSIWNFIFGNGGSFRYTEERLEIGSDVYATGMFYTFNENDAFIQKHLDLENYINEKKQINILSSEGLGQKQALLISVLGQRKVVREYKLKSFLYFLGFIFFSIIIVNSTYPMVKTGWEHWLGKNALLKSILFNPSQ